MGERFEYEYDAVGHRTVMTDTTGTTLYEYDPANRLTSVDGVTHTWDARGNLLSDGTFTYAYNAAGRLVRAESLAATIVYTYNSDGLRVAQSMDGDATTFAWDWASGVPELLRQGQTRYLVGHDTLGWHDGKEHALSEVEGWTYSLPDALGSVRQATDAAGAVVSAREWMPFGVAVGAAQMGLGYTGEWWDADVGLEYLRARWYQPGTGRFTQQDPWAGNLLQPQSLNHYGYVLGNPVNARDPAGLCVDTDGDGICGQGGNNARDLTDWLYRELVENAKHATVRRLRTLNSIAYGGRGTGLVGCGIGIVAKQPLVIAGGGVLIVGGAVIHRYVALEEFRGLVANGGRWDFKDEIGLRLGPGITLCADGSYDDIEYSVPGNIHYAYIGAAAGIFGWEIQYGAGWAETNDPAHVPGSEEYAGPYAGEQDHSPWWNPGQWNFGDEPTDHEAVTLGIILWRKYKASMNRTQFASELAGYVSKLSRHDPLPRPVVPKYAKDWPYPVGYFDNAGNVYNINQE